MGVKPQKNGPRTILYSGTILDFMYLEKFGRLGKGEGPVVQACTKKAMLTTPCGRFCVIFWSKIQIMLT